MMQKFGKQGYQKPSRTKRVGLIFAVTMAVVFLLAGMVFYQYKHNPIVFARINHMHDAMQQWLIERKSHLQASLHHRIDKVKTAVKEVEKTDTVHFEFYSVLPNMQIGAADTVRPEEARSAVSKDVKHASRRNNKSKSSAMDKLLFSQDDIDRDFAETVKRKRRG